jgi:hypothetical protein
MIITLVFKKNANFFAENEEKSQKFVIITSTSGPQDTMKDLNGRTVLEMAELHNSAFRDWRNILNITD